MRFILSLCMAFMVLPTWAGAERLQAFADQLRTFEADFVQETPRDESDILGVDIHTGHVALQRPGKLYWRYDKAPQGPQLLVVDGRALWAWDPDLEQVTVQPIEQVIKDIPLNWLLYQIPIASKFRIIDAGEADGLHWYNLRPKKDTYFESMDVGLDAANRLKAITLYQSNDRVERVRFERVRINQPVDASLFVFRIPEGADVVGELPR
ncbi:outer membrane lipoprotein carrier protein LolA [Candidatus Parcubacteria bacterium]|nr:MAG: outer membrane lipoprotein carrier protein LolA [Candidatus Parcubacteria bacterium]